MSRRNKNLGINFRLLGILEELSLNMDITNIDAVTEKLRVLYKSQEFGRQKQQAQRQMVQRTVRYMINQGTADAPHKPSIDLDSKEQIDVDFDVSDSDERSSRLNSKILNMYNNELNGNMEKKGGSKGVAQSTPKRPRGSNGEEVPKRQKQTQNAQKKKDDGKDQIRGKNSSNVTSSISTPNEITYEDLGGIDEVLNDIKKLIEYPLKYPEVYSELGIEPTRGLLLHGPPGCGKTALANAIANECGVPFLRISAPEVVSGMSGESEAKIRQLFNEAANVAPSIVFIDEIDAICPKREIAQREMEKRIVAQILLCMDQLPTIKSKRGGGQAATEEDENQDEIDSRAHVVVLGATNRPDALDTALRRAGRFDREIKLGIPSEEARIRILQVITQNLKLNGQFDFREIARKTPGYVGADIIALCSEAGNTATSRIFKKIEEQQQNQRDEEDDHMEDSEDEILGQDGKVTEAALANMALTIQDFMEAIERVQPSVKREGFSTTPLVTWDDVGALKNVREELSFSIAKPILKPERFKVMGMLRATGVLLFGPPGCGKTLVAQAVANESGANFISIKGPELLNKYVGESERAVRQVFERAAAAKPCVLFFDEMDALAPKRGTESNLAAERLVNQLLAEMDGVNGRAGVYVIAATNRPDMIDSALLRPGRLDKILFVPLPSQQGRLDILQTLTKSRPLDTDVDLKYIAKQERCEGMTGADLANLLTEACMSAIKENWGEEASLTQTDLICQRHFIQALSRVQASVSKKDARRYEELKNRLHCYRAHVGDDQGENS